MRTLDRLYGTLRDLADIEPSATPVDPGQHRGHARRRPQYAAGAGRNRAHRRRSAGKLPRSRHRCRRRHARLKGELLGAGLALGLLQQEPAAWFARGADGGDDARIQALVDERNAAKKARDFARADAIREQLAGEGILLEDTPQGVRWRRA